MIVDSIENISKYSFISQNVIDFIKGLSPAISEGHYDIDEESYANVDVYEPKLIEKCKFEAHKKYIDIQILLEGEEEIDCININHLDISEKYDENRDVMFFKDSDNIPDKIILKPSKFVFIYPHEAHKPQIKTNSQSVKKAVIKIKTHNKLL